MLCICCMRWNITSIKDKRFGRLTAIEQMNSDKHGNVLWKCRCECGKEKIISGAALRKGRTRSCGCLFEEVNRRKRKAPFTVLYNKILWAAKSTNKECGLKFEEFLEFTRLSKCHYCNRDLEWTAHRSHGAKAYTGYNLDRMDNLMGYSKENCVVCCPICNHVKGKILSYAQMKKLGPVLREVLMG